MAGIYKWKKLSELNIDDEFFNSLKEDYPEFETWFKKKAKEGKSAFVYLDKNRLGAFVMLKSNENEVIELKDAELPKCNRLKISTLKLSENVQGNRLGEGAIGIALWKWLESDDEEIYVTVFEKHKKLIDMLKKFGFINVGYNIKNECVFLKSKKRIDFSTPYTSFPFISRNQEKFAMLPIEARWHDKLFPYSELMHTKQETEEFAAANGITKTYICFPRNSLSYEENEPILIYRIHDGENKGFKSVITSYGTVVRCVRIKERGVKYKSLSEYKKIVGNKSVFSNKAIEDFYMEKNLYVVELVYNHAFGAGNNVNYNTLKMNGIWANCHPFQAEYSFDDFIRILSLAKQNPKKLIK